MAFPQTHHAAAVQDLLRARYGSPLTVARAERLAPWAVSRLWLHPAGPAPETVVVKWAPPTPRDDRTALWRLRTEAAALTFLSDDLGIVLGPRVLATDPGHRFLVLEDLSPRVALDELLRRDGAAAHTDRLAAFARARGTLGAATAGHAATYRARRAAPPSARATTDEADRLAPRRHEAIAHATALGVPPDSRATGELASAMDELSEPGPFLALSNNDAQANNVLLHPTGAPDARLIDFEFAGCTHALADAVCLYVPGPAWLTVGDPTATGTADAYRRALAEGIPQAEDDHLYAHGLAAACVAWALLRLHRFPLLDARPSGDPSRLQLVATLEAAAGTARTHRALPHLTGWLSHLASVLRARWPDADQDLTDPATFPPYRPRQPG